MLDDIIKPINIHPIKTILKKQDAFAQGKIISGKNSHEIYKFIQNKSNLASIKQGELFSLKSSNLSQYDMTLGDLITILNRLMRDNLVLQIPCFYIESHTKKLEVLSVFISHPENEKGRDNLS